MWMGFYLNWTKCLCTRRTLASNWMRENVACCSRGAKHTGARHRFDCCWYAWVEYRQVFGVRCVYVRERDVSVLWQAVLSSGTKATWCFFSIFLFFLCVVCTKSWMSERLSVAARQQQQQHQQLQVTQCALSLCVLFVRSDHKSMHLERFDA